MKIVLNTEVDATEVIEKVSTIDIVPIIEKRPDKAEILEAFSADELSAYFIHNKLIDETLVAYLIEEKKLNLELILGKIAVSQFQKTMNNSPTVISI